MVLTVRLSSGHTERAGHTKRSVLLRSDAVQPPKLPTHAQKIGTARLKMREDRAGTDAWAIWGGSAVAQ